MGTGGFGTVSAPSVANLVEQKLRAENVMKAGASWFLWVAGLSMVNSILALSGSGFRFIFGLGMAQVVDALAHQAGDTGLVLDLVINSFVAALEFRAQGAKLGLHCRHGPVPSRWPNPSRVQGYSGRCLSCLCFVPYL